MGQKAIFRLLIILFSVFPLTTISSQSISVCQENDYLALRSLYLSTDGDNWTSSTNWPNEAFFLANPTMPLGTNISTWQGVFVDTDGILTILKMPSANNISGPLPPEIGLFCRIQEIEIRNNQLSGTIPIQFWDLTTLVDINFSTNSGNNELTGTLPAQIGQLTNLVILDLWNNELFGPLPPEIGFLTNLTRLSLGGNTGFNEFSGPLPSSICSLTNLTYLNLGNNKFIGPLPACIGTFTSLTYLNVGGNPNTNDFSGPLPDLSALVNLTDLYMQNNSLTGPMPAYLASFTNLIRLSMQQNMFSGCYDIALFSLCSQLLPNFNQNGDISGGNMFDEPWEDFCATTIGACCDAPDTQNPIVSCTGPSFFETVNTGNCDAAVVNFQADAEASMMPWDNCGISSVVCFPSSGSTFLVGTSTVQCNAIDLSGNWSQSCTFTVEVLTSQLFADANPVTDESCQGAADGSIMMQVAGGQAPLSYAWSNGATTQNISSLSAGTYTLTITDALGCTAIESATISTTPDNINPSVNCVGTPLFEIVNTGNCDAAVVNFQADVEASMMPTDNCGVAMVVCSPASGSTLPVGVNLVFCEALDFAGNMSQSCTFTLEVLTSQLFASANPVVDESCPNAGDGSIDMQVSGGLAPLSYSWSNGATTEDVSGLSPGTYTITITDALGCTVIETATISTIPDITPPFASCTGPTFFENADPTNCMQAVVNYQADALASMMVSDNCSITTVTCFPASGTVFPVGQSNVFCQAFDVSMNASSQCTFTIEVLACPCPNTLNITGVAPNGINQAFTSVTSTASVNLPTDVTYKAGQFVEMNAGFMVQQQATFLAKIETCN